MVGEKMKYDKNERKHTMKNEYGKYYIYCFVSVENALKFIEQYKKENDYVRFLLDGSELHIFVYDCAESYDHIHICQMTEFQEYNDISVVTHLH